jgi:plastocyanin
MGIQVKQGFSWPGCRNATLMRVAMFTVGLLFATVSSASDVSGTVTLFADGKPLRATESREAVVYFKSSVNVPLAVPKMPFVMRTERKVFVPSVLPVLLGSQVVFPNSDPILHNAFSSSLGNIFDTGLYGKGEGESNVFKTVGVVRVYCNVHHSMTANILVLNTPYFASPDAQGRFVFKNVPKGAGDLFIWHDRATLWRKALVVDGLANLSEAVSLNLVKKRIPPHVNKFGRPYRRSNDGGY